MQILSPITYVANPQFDLHVKEQTGCTSDSVVKVCSGQLLSIQWAAGIQSCTVYNFFINKHAPSEVLRELYIFTELQIPAR